MDGPLPLGFRFSPTDSELIHYFLKEKVRGQLSPSNNEILEADVYKLSPSQLPGVGAKKKRVFYFLAKRKKQTRTRSGYWKSTSSTAEEIVDTREMRAIGLKRSLAYVTTDKESNDANLSWNMKEYSILGRNHEEEEEKEEWVICKITKKKKNAYTSSKKDEEEDDDDHPSSKVISSSSLMAPPPSSNEKRHLLSTTASTQVV